MIDVYPDIRSALNTILPTHYEMTLHSGFKVPCISYMEVSNVDRISGETLGYSDISFQVKVWSTDISDIQKYSSEVDRVLRPLGWKRTSVVEAHDNNSSMIQKVMTYTAIGCEEFDY